MVIRLLFLFFVISFNFQSCGDCKPDKFGENLELVVPISISPAKDSFSIGDTLLVEAHFNKQIAIYDKLQTIQLDSFNFFTDFLVLEISDTVENYYPEIDTLVEIGHVGYLPLQNALAYPLTFIEDDSGYHLLFKVILKSKGMLWIAFSTSSFFYEKPYYDHPGLYVCDQNRRDQVSVYYDNPNTTFGAYKDIFLKTNVDYLKQNVDFEEYKKAGSICIFVQ